MVRTMLKALWAAAGTEEGVAQQTIPLPAGSGEPAAMAQADGFLAIGTRRGRLLLLNALAPAEVLDSIELAHPIVAAEALSPSDQQYRGVPALVLTTERAVFRLDLLPVPTATLLWEAPTPYRCAAPAVPVGGGVLAFRTAEADAVQAEWIALDGSAKQDLGLFEGPLGRPLRLDQDRAFFYSEGAGHLFSAGSPGPVRTREFKQRMDPSIPSSYLQATEEVFLAYHGNGGYGVARVATADLDAWTCGDPIYNAVQVLAVDRRSMAVASSTDLELRHPLSGQRNWSMREHLQVDTLDFTRFEPTPAEGHALLTAQGRGQTPMVLMMPLNQEGVREGPRRILDVHHPVLPPIALAGGVVVAEYADGVPRLVVAQPREIAT